MLENSLLFLHGALLLVFGVSLTAAFAGLRWSKRNILIFLGFAAFAGGLQLAASLTLSESAVWKLYPLITHLPLIVLLCTVYRKPLVTAMASAFTAYLCCQPPKWFGILMREITGSQTVETVTRMICLVLVGYVALFHLSGCLSDIFAKDRRSVCIFGIVPTFYYGFDYVTVVYTSLWHDHDQVVMELLPFFLAVIYMIFCFVYYKEYEQKADALRKEQIVRIAVEQQAKEMQTVKQIEQEIRLLRHDMRLFLSSLAVSLENGDTDKAKDMIAAHIAYTDRVRLQRFCNVDVINYVLSDYADKCAAEGIAFTCKVELGEFLTNEILFSSILSNGLDNALNVQKRLPPEKRSIKLMLKDSDGKLLLSVKNPVAQPVIFADGLPVSGKKGHGYGTQSIRYLTERLGGNCQFTVQEDVFILRVVLQNTPHG